MKLSYYGSRVKNRGNLRNINPPAICGNRVPPSKYEPCVEPSRWKSRFQPVEAFQNWAQDGWFVPVVGRVGQQRERPVQLGGDDRPEQRAVKVDASLDPGIIEHGRRGGGECVEVADRNDAVLIRDTKDRSSGHLAVDAVEWRRFVRQIKAGTGEDK